MIDVIKQIVETLEEMRDWGMGLTEKDKIALQAGKQLIAELESQEPVAHCTVRPLRGDESYPKTEILWVKGRPIAGPLYTHPPQRTWVGLADEEHCNIWYKESLDWMEYGKAIEAKLKEKNT